MATDCPTLPARTAAVTEPVREGALAEIDCIVSRLGSGTDDGA